MLTLNERRRKVDATALDGGDTIYMQQQDHSMEAIAARDALLIEQANNPPPPDPAPVPPPANDNSDEARAVRSLVRRTRLTANVGLKAVPLSQSDAGATRADIALRKEHHAAAL